MYFDPLSATQLARSVPDPASAIMTLNITTPKSRFFRPAQKITYYSKIVIYEFYYMVDNKLYN